MQHARWIDRSIRDLAIEMDNLTDPFCTATSKSRMTTCRLHLFIIDLALVISINWVLSLVTSGE